VDWWSVLEIMIGVVLGGVLNWLFSLKASKELRQEAEKLRTLMHLIIRAMHNAGLAEVRWNERGEPEGLVIKISAASGGRSSMSANPTGRREEEPD
jgi:hypothetical protein